MKVIKPCTFGMCLCYSTEFNGNGKCMTRSQGDCAYYQNHQKAIEKLKMLASGPLGRSTLKVRTKAVNEVLKLLEGNG
jgi:hypothetical protein